MGLRRKSTVKSGSKVAPHDAGEQILPNRKRPSKSRLMPQVNLVDADLNALLNGSPLAAPPPSPAVEDPESAIQKVEQAKQQLGNLECEIISALFPLSGTPESFESLATRLGMSVKEVRDVADNALRGLRGTKGFPPRPSSAWN